MSIRWVAVAVGVVALGGAIVVAAPVTGIFTSSSNRSLPPAAWERVSRQTIDQTVLQGLLKPAATRLAYAKACAIDIGTIPAYNCMTQGELVPVTKNGVEVAASATGNDCDNPVKLPMSQDDGQCIRGSRLVDLSPANNPDVTVMAICRRYHPMPANSTQFNDLAIVAHNRKTGTTCFFQSRVDGESRQDDPTHAPTQPYDGTNVPSPMADSAAARDFWLEPAKNDAGVVEFTAPRGINCVGCHDSDPFILSPWIAQKAKTEKWDPLKKYLVDRAGPFSPLDQRPWVTAGISKPQPFTQFKKCVVCHRIGGGSLTVVSAGPGGLTASNGFYDFHGFMPPNNDYKAGGWGYIYNEAIFELDNCVHPAAGAAPAAGCNTRRGGTIQ